jgi:hypothetical protein
METIETTATIAAEETKWQEAQANLERVREQLQQESAADGRKATTEQLEPLIDPDSTTCPTTRDVECALCLKRGAATRTRFTQTHMMGTWMPFSCFACGEWLQERDAVRRRLDLTAARIREFEASALPVVYTNGQRTDAVLEGAPPTDGFKTARLLCERLRHGTLKGTRPWLWLHDERGGTFKSTLACLTLAGRITARHDALAVEESDKPRQILGGGRYVNWPDFLRLVRKTFATRDESSEMTEFDLVEALIDAPLLLVDDLGAEDATSFGGNMIYALLQGRMDRDTAAIGRRGMVITSNTSVSEFVARYEGLADPRKSSRIERRLADFTAEICMVDTEVQ